MEKIADYTLLEKLSKNSKSQIFRAVNENTKKTVILKMLMEDYANAARISLFQKEFEIISAISSPLVIKAVELINHNNLPVMVLEDCGGVSLKEFIKQSINDKEHTLSDKLQLAILIIQALTVIHKYNFIHKDINPSNIIFNPITGDLNIIDFGLATELSFEQSELSNYNVLEGTLAYISPEQTGRMNRNIDYRSDYYSLGITLYELFSGELPFTASSPREWVHCHIAKSYIPLCERLSSIPATISAIIDKLLAKTAEDRYQSSYGILADLKKCVESLTHTGSIEAFVLGKNDVSQKFDLLQKLYGRETEIKQLYAAFEELPIWNSELVLVKGYSGIGKTSLIGEIAKPVTQKNGYYISGKFDEHKRESPYLAIIQAFTGFISYILSEGEEEIKQWKSFFEADLGENAQIIIDVIPEFEKIMGSQAKIVELPAIEAQNRFIVTFLKFVQCITQNAFPLVMVLDDLNWADAASLEMIKNLLVDSQENSIMIIGAYRTNEMTLIDTIDVAKSKMEALGIKIFDIDVSPLQSIHINQLIQDVFNCNALDSIELAQLCYEKTQGNPFFLKEFLHDLFNKSYIFVDETKGRWSWNIDFIRHAKATDNVVEILASRIQSLTLDTQTVLMQAACIGSHFDLNALSKLSTMPIEVLQVCLNQAHEATFIQPMDRFYSSLSLTADKNISFKFVHDRVRSSAYGLLTSDKRNNYHYIIGKYFLNSYSEQEKEENIFTITEHLNKGKEFLQPDERKILTRLNIKAGRKAKSSAAFLLLFHYVTRAIDLLEPDIWRTDYRFALTVFTEAAEAAYLDGSYNKMEEFSQIILSNATSILDLAGLREIRILAFQSQHKHEQAVSEAFTYLRALGVYFPKKAKVPHLLASLVSTRLLLSKYNAERITNLPKVTNAQAETSLRIMGVLVYTLYDTNPVLLALIIFKIIKLTLKNGTAPISPMSFMMYGMLINVMLGKIKEGYEYGQIGMSLLRKMNAKKHWAQTSVCNNLGVKIWKEPIRNSIEGLLDDFNISLETGDISFAVNSLATCTNYQFYNGEGLQKIMDTAQKYKRSLAHIPYHAGMRNMDMQLQAIYNLQNPVEHLELLTGSYFDETSDKNKQDETPSQLANIYLLKMIVCYYFNDTQHAFEFAIKGRKYVQSVIGIMHYAMFHFYESLVNLAHYDKMTYSQKQVALKRIYKNQKTLKKWELNAPMNFSNKINLIEAEIHRIKGNFERAGTLFDLAIAQAKEQGFISEEACANELAGKLWLRKEKHEFASLYFTRAYKLFDIWGANAKTTTLIAENKGYITIHDRSSLQNSTKTTTQSSLQSEHSQTHTIDVETMMDAAKSISKEIVLSVLFENVLKIIIEHAGAEKGVLLLTNFGTGELQIEARGLLLENEVQVTVQKESIERNVLPLRVISYVNRSQQVVLLHDALKDTTFARDYYFTKHTIKSVLVIPILHQSKLNGILYLENNKASNVFIENKIGVLTMLCTQAAISIENARLYQSLEQKVCDRTKEVVQQKEIIELKNKEITDSILYAKRIQGVILPSETMFSTLFTDYFIIYKPKDIVSGDFYWLQEIDKKRIIAVADCTGHGVPGGFMSMLGSTFLNEIIVKGQNTNPANVLNRLRQEIIYALQQKGVIGEQRDGMDISLCFIDIEKMSLTFSGAYSSIYIIRNKNLPAISTEFAIENSEAVLYEMKADKMPISHTYKMHDFTSVEIDLCKNDVIIMSTDGLKDQIGGEFNKKFMSKQLKDLLIQNHHHAMKDIKTIINKQLDEWMFFKQDGIEKPHEQVDDITVLGIKI